MMTSIGSLPGTFGSGLSEPVISPSLTPLYVESTFAAHRSDTGIAVSAAIADSPFNISRLFILYILCQIYEFANLRIAECESINSICKFLIDS